MTNFTKDDLKTGMVRKPLLDYDNGKNNNRGEKTMIVGDMYWSVSLELSIETKKGYLTEYDIDMYIWCDSDYDEIRRRKGLIFKEEGEILDALPLLQLYFYFGGICDWQEWLKRERIYLMMYHRDLLEIYDEWLQKWRHSRLPADFYEDL